MRKSIALNNEDIKLKIAQRSAGFATGMLLSMLINKEGRSVDVIIINLVLIAIVDICTLVYYKIKGGKEENEQSNIHSRH